MLNIRRASLSRSLALIGFASPKKGSLWKDRWSKFYCGIAQLSKEAVMLRFFCRYRVLVASLISFAWWLICYNYFRQQRWSYQHPHYLLHWTPSQLPSPLLLMIVYQQSLISICAKSLVLKSSMKQGKTPRWCFPPSADWQRGVKIDVFDRKQHLQINFVLVIGKDDSCIVNNV